MGKIIRAFFSRLNFWVMAGLLFALCSLVYVVALRHNQRFDLTKDKLFTLSPKTNEILGGMGTEDISVKAFFKENQPGKEELEDLFKIYSHQAPNFHYQFIDPDRNPGQAKTYNVDEYGAIIVERGGKKERFNEITEEALTNTLLKLVQSHQNTIVFTKGHGEKPLDGQEGEGYSALKKRLESENYTVQEALLSRDSIPAEADVVAVAGPTTDFLPEEIRTLKQYFEKGGRLLLLLDPVQASLTHFAGWLETYGVTIGQDVVIDKLSRVFGADYLIPVVTQYGRHAITEGFNMASFLPFSRSISIGKQLPEGYAATELALTGQGSWAETDWKQIEGGQATFDEEDPAGPICLAAVIENEQSASRLAVYGDSDFADNSHLYLSGNKDLILNTVAWLAGEEKLVSIRSKVRESNPLILSAGQQQLIFIFPVFALPVASLGSGLLVFLYRKKYT